MKRFVSTVGLVVLAAVSSHAQGTIAFGNSALTRVTACAAPGALLVNFDPAVLGGNIQIGVFVNGSDTPVQGLATIGTTAGVMINAPSVYALPGTDAGQVVSLQIRAWDVGVSDWHQANRFYGQTDVRQVTLGPTAGPGQVIWQTATGANPNRFHPLVIQAQLAGPCIPEPSTIALAALGLGSLLLFRRRK
jgi:hypothetical protein